MSVAKWDTGAYEGWRNHLVKFANTAYTQADKDTFKMSVTPQLPADFKGTVFEDDVLDRVVETVKATVRAKDTGELAGTDDEGSDIDDADDDEGIGGQKRPAPSLASTSTQAKRQKVDKDKAGLESPDPLLVMVDGRLISRYELEREANIRRNKAILEGLNINLGALPKATGTKPPATKKAPVAKPVDTEMVERRQSGRLKGSSAGNTGAGEPMDVDNPMEGDAPMDIDTIPTPTPLTNGQASPPIIPPSDLPEAPPSSPTQGSSSVVPIPALTSGTALIPVTPPVVIHEPSTVDPSPTKALSSESATRDGNGKEKNIPIIDTPGTQVDDEARELLLEVVDWFGIPYRVFAAPGWGQAWKMLLESFVKLEGSVEFGEARGSLPAQGRPAILSEWVADGRLKPKKGGAAARRMLSLKAKDLPVFKASFIGWWDSMQPSWRKEKDGKWLRTRHGRDFEGLDVWGQNGWLSVVACLYWWREALTEEDGESVWEEYVTDAAWMMEGLRLRGFQ